MLARLTTAVATGLSLAALALVGCVDPAADEDDTGTVVDGKGDGISSFKITLTKSSGILRGRETPKLPGATSGSTALFACRTDDRTENGWRLLCARGHEQLRFTYDPEDKVGAGIYVKADTSPDKRSFYHCAATTAAADEWPGELTCTAKTPKTIISGQLISPFTSSLDDIGLFNAHLVSESNGAKVYRGMKPFRDADYADLESLGIDAVLIFKKPTGATEVADEIDALAPIGVPASRVSNVEFPWKDFADFEEPCRMTVRSLKLLEGWRAAGKTSFFHCTVGEDRTGYLAGLYRLLHETATPREIFASEMCERGYSAGNPQKPFAAVVKEVDTDLTPLFVKMAFKIKQGELTPTSLDESVCDTDPETDAAFTATEWNAEDFRCSISTRYRL
jgi:hypothetical protein